MTPEDVANALDQPGFSWKTAQFLALASKLSYSPADTVMSVCVETWGFKNAVFIDVDETHQAFVAHNSTDLIVCFRGTESLGDWLVDLNIRRASRSYGDVHEGFLEAYQAIEPTMVEAMRSADAGNKRLWLTGHSLGGALAVVAALEFRGPGAMNGLYTFGQPRSVNWESAKFGREKFGDVFCRLVNDDDVVTRVPPHFWHFGNLVHFDSNGEVQRVSAELEAVGIEKPALTEEEFEAVKQQIRATQKDLEISASGNESAADPGAEGVFNVNVSGLIPSVADHSMDRYVSLINRHADSLDGE